jgi:tRNA-dihydrouridine synthase A
VLAELHRRVFDDGWQLPEAGDLLERMAAYAEREVAAGERPAAITRHMLGLYTGQPGARRFRQDLSEGARSLGTGAPAADGIRRIILHCGK